MHHSLPPLVICRFLASFSKLNRRMFLSFRTTCRSRSAFRFTALAVAVMTAAALHATGQGTHLWTQSRLEEFEKGTPQGVALTSDGHLREGPSLTELATTPSTYVWSVAVDKVGTAYVGTASPATVLRVGQDGKPFTIWQLHERLWSACRRAGPRQIRWHDLGHSCASQLAGAGVPLNQIQHWLAHSTITMTMRYVHLAPGSGADLITAPETPTSVAASWQQGHTEATKLSDIS